MRRFNVFVAAAAVLCVGSLIAQEPAKDRQTNREDDKKAATSNADQEIAAVKLAECRNEIELAKLAQQKSQNEQVKQFAAKLVKDHTDACTQLEKWAEHGDADRDSADRAVKPGAGVAVEAGREGVNVDVRGGQGSSLNWVAIHKQLADRCLASAKKELAQKEGAEFDKCFIGMQIAAHQKMVDADMVFASYVAPENRDKIEACGKVAAEHLRSAKEIMEKLDGKTSVRSASRE